MIKLTKKVVVIAVIITIIFSAIGLYLISPVSSNSDDTVRITIPQASTSSDIGDILFEKDLIRNEFAFKVFSRLRGASNEFGAGTYDLKKSMSMNQIINKIVSGAKGGELKLTVPEGSEIVQIAEILNKAGMKDKDKFISLTKQPEKFIKEYPFLRDIPEGYNLEGYLYPDTYYLDKSDIKDPELIIIKMLENFKNHFTEDMANKGQSQGLNINQIVTMASLIEREAQSDSDRELVSAVFHNRIKQNMYLESCASVQYILGERKAILSLDDIDIESPYNTYRNAGLPPAPIASPGIKSLESAVSPAEVDYLFFVAKGDGTHVFSSTFEEHLAAQEEYQN